MADHGMADRRAQLGLFAELPQAPRVEPVDDPSASALAVRVPPFVRLGTSSWTFPGWAGLVYKGKPSLSDLVAGGLRAYAQHPLLRTVGMDRSHYAPLSDPELAGYAAQLPADFRVVSKVWDEITTLVFPRHRRYGARAGTRNTRFLDPDLVLEHVVEPALRSFSAHAGPFVFEITPIPQGAAVDADAVPRALDGLLSALPKTFRWAVELRNRELLSREYLRVLAAHGAGHVLNFWTGMPTIGQQLASIGLLPADFVVTRLLLPPFARYEDMRDAFAPFDRIVSPQPEMRADVVRLALACARGGKELFILTNNKAEGSSPCTVRALAEDIANAFDAHGGDANATSSRRP